MRLFGVEGANLSLLAEGASSEVGRGHTPLIRGQGLKLNLNLDLCQQGDGDQIGTGQVQSCEIML